MKRDTTSAPSYHILPKPFTCCFQVLRRYKLARGVIFDLPDALAPMGSHDNGGSHPEEEEVEARLVRVAGSFLDGPGMRAALDRHGGCNMMVLKFILHDWGDEVSEQDCLLYISLIEPFGAQSGVDLILSDGWMVLCRRLSASFPTLDKSWKVISV